MHRLGERVLGSLKAAPRGPWDTVVFIENGRI